MRAPDLRRANWEWELGEEEWKKRELGWLAAGLPGWLVSLFYFFSSLSKMGSLVREKVL